MNIQNSISILEKKIKDDEMNITIKPKQKNYHQFPNNEFCTFCMVRLNSKASLIEHCMGKSHANKAIKESYNITKFYSMNTKANYRFLRSNTRPGRYKTLKADIDHRKLLYYSFPIDGRMLTLQQIKRSYIFNWISNRSKMFSDDELIRHLVGLIECDLIDIKISYGLLFGRKHKKILKYYCKTCNRSCTNANDYKAHIISKKHINKLIKEQNIVLSSLKDYDINRLIHEQHLNKSVKYTKVISVLFRATENPTRNDVMYLLSRVKQGLSIIIISDVGSFILEY